MITNNLQDRINAAMQNGDQETADRLQARIDAIMQAHMAAAANQAVPGPPGGVDIFDGQPIMPRR